MLQTLIRAKIDEESFQGILSSTTGLLFFGVPFRGTDTSLSQGQLLALAKEECEYGGTVQDKAIQILDGRSDSLEELVDDYHRVVRQKQPPNVICFYEEEVSDGFAVLQGREKNMVIITSLIKVPSTNELSGIHC